ncbi:VTT domain-containing protein [Candidatus Kaiserbacteria bacterium]|nr:VTT domain-containing protein [Candidatus Kaiserbacteria bacterium]
MYPFFLDFISGAVGSQILLLSLAIILCAAVLEDVTTIIVGVLAADGLIAVPVALFSLYAGVILGDIGLYSLGRLARTHPRLARYVDHDLIAPFRAWLASRYVLTVFSARFIPGSRLPTYTASGFFRSRFSIFALTILAAISVWTTALFSAAYWFGSISSKWLVHARWGLALLLLAVLFLVARHNIKMYRAKKSEL